MMKIVITTPTGKVGSQVAERLVGTDHELVLLARDAAKVKPLTDKGATVQTGSVDDTGYLIDATRGADALLLVIPPDYASNDYRATQNRFGDSAIAAINENKTPRVVFLSSVAAHLGDGFGPVTGLGDVERKLQTTDADVTFFRPGAFMENLFLSVQGIASDGAIYMPVAGNVETAMVAVSDIAELGADILQDTTWTGKRTVELCGPESISFDHVADEIGDALGKTVSHVEVSPGQAMEGLMGMGISKNVSETYIEMYDAVGKGKFDFEGTPEKGKVSFKAFVEQVFVPGFNAMTQ